MGGRSVAVLVPRKINAGEYEREPCTLMLTLNSPIDQGNIHLAELAGQVLVADVDR
jgi:hypothetical protein